MKGKTPYLANHAIVPILAGTLILVTSLSVIVGEQSFSTTMTEMLIRAVIVIGLSIFVGNSGVISFGHIAFCCIGAYAAAWVDAAPGFKQIMLSGLPDLLRTGQFGFLPSLVFAAVLAAIVALLLGLVIMRLSGIAASIATFAFLVMVNSIYSNWDSVTGGSSSIIGIPTVVSPWIACASAIAALLVAYVFRISRFGLMLQATRDDEVAAKAVGINVNRVRLVAFVLSAAVVGVAGGLYAHFLGILTIDAFYLDLTFITLSMLIVGGMDHLGGAIVGVLTVTFVVQTLRMFEHGVALDGVVLKLPDGTQEVGLGLTLALILLYSPRGLIHQILRLHRALSPRRTELRLDPAEQV